MEKTEIIGRMKKIIRKHFGLFASELPTREVALEIYEKVVENARKEGEATAKKGLRRPGQSRHAVRKSPEDGDGVRGSAETGAADSQGAEGAHASGNAGEAETTWIIINLVWLVLAVAFMVGWLTYKYKDCREVGHSKTYCIIQLGR